MMTREGEVDDVEFWKAVEPLLHSGLGDINSIAPTGAVANAVDLLLNRIVSTVHTLLTLGRHCDVNTYCHDARTLLRACYDAYVQAAFILTNRTMAEEMAQDYLDFQIVERHRFIDKIAKSNTSFASEIMSSPLRAPNEPALRREFQRVAPRFTTKNGNLRKNWYKGELRSLAEACGIVEEYDFLISTLHPSVHSSAFALVCGGGAPHQHVTFFAMRLIFRLLGRLGTYYRVTFSNNEVQATIESFTSNLFVPLARAAANAHP